jgi:hypothetical protein
MFLILLYTMGLATIVLIQIGLMHLSPKIFSTDMSILKNTTGSLSLVFQYLTKYCSCSRLLCSTRTKVHVSTCKISTKIFHNETLPHFGSLWRSLATHEATMTLRIILCQGFGKSISNLILCVNGEYFDKAIPHMFAKMLVAYVDVLVSRAKLGKPCQFEGA